jgi:AI-2 transport protein TqsA
LGFSAALVVAGGYLVINILIGTFIEPRYMGRGLGLSTLVVFISLVFWGWVLGPVGMLLSVPLTITAKIALESHDGTRWVAIMLGPKVEPEIVGDSLPPPQDESAG